MVVSQLWLERKSTISGFQPLPTLLGESIVLRILDKSKVLVRLEDAGMSEFCYKEIYNVNQSTLTV